MMRSALVFSPPLALVGAAGWLTLNRAKLPERWPIHWGVDGQPDGWAGPSTAYIPLGVGLLAWATLEVLARVLERCTYPNMDEKSSDICGKARADLLRCISLAVCLILAAVGGILPFHTESTASPYFLWIILSFLLLCIGAATWLYKHRVSEANLPPGYGALAYMNPDDPRIWVPKLSGSGRTLNLAHTKAKALLMLILLMPIAILIGTLLT